MIRQPRFLTAAALMLTSVVPLLAQQPVSGTVTYDGPELRVRAIRMGADPSCQEITQGERVLAPDRIVSDSGGLKNVFVYLDEAPAGTGGVEPGAPAVLTQRGCMYEPHVQGVLAGQEVEIRNQDPTLHNVRCLAEDNPAFNIGQPPGVEPRIKVFRKPEEAVKFKCDIHPWMSAYIFVMEHPFFAVTDESGAFEIESVPPGAHTLVFWHESFGRQTQRIEVGDSPVTDASTTFSGD